MTTVSELAQIIGGEVEGDGDRSVSTIRPPEDVLEGCVVFVSRAEDAPQVLRLKPAAIICSKAAKIEPGDTALIRCENPRISFGLAMRFFFPPEEFEGFVHETAVIEDGAVVYPGAHVDAGCFVGAGSMVGEGAVLRPACLVGRNVTIGAKCLLHPGATVNDWCTLGERVILHSGSVIGADGFGFFEDEGFHFKVPQVGKVSIEDDVEIGANSAVDRATLGVTRVGRGTKIDNLVQVGHNCDIGENCIICGSVGISGSVTIGDGTVLGGQAGVSDHVTIGERCVIGGKAGVIDDVPDGSFYSGFPARPHRKTMRILSLMGRLPEMAKKLDALYPKTGDSE